MKKLLIGFLFLFGCSNAETPAGYVGYVTQGAFLGKTKFIELQKGPTSTGLGWLLSTTNVSITPYTYTEDFSGNTAVLSKDNLKVEFNVHILWRVNPEKVKEFIELYSYLQSDDNPDKIALVAYGNNIKEPIRTGARNAIQKLNALDIKDHIDTIGQNLTNDAVNLTKDTPFIIQNIVVGNIQYPSQVSDAVSEKMAATQILERKQTEIEIEQAEAKKRVAQARGIADSMDIINKSLTDQYLTHEAIEAQKIMANSPNHTSVFIPTGKMGIPLVKQIGE
jgi:regulator of protease activity HflC (stomatin/prohibitin superfamily)